jgi:hypothetical protein
MLNIRHPTRKKAQFPPTPHPSISDGNEKKVLEGMLKFKGIISNTRRFSEYLKLPRSTIKDTYLRLISKGYVIKQCLGVYELTDKGKQINSALLGVADSSAGGGGASGRFSTHYLTYKGIISTKENNWKEKLELLNYKDIKELNNKNNPQTILYFEDCTLIITKFKLIVRIHDIIRNDLDISLLESFNKAVDKFADCKKIGIITNSMILEDSHYALMNTYFSEALDKVNNKFFLKLSDGSSFWIDKSHGATELESNNKQLIENLDTFIDYEKDNDITDDFIKMKQLLSESIRNVKDISRQNVLTATALHGMTELIKNTVLKEQKEETSINHTESELRPKYIG